MTPSVQETLSGNVKSDVKAKNTGTAPAYIRAAVDIYWQDATSGARLWEEPQAGTDYEIVWNEMCIRDRAKNQNTDDAALDVLDVAGWPEAR